MEMATDFADYADLIHEKYDFFRKIMNLAINLRFLLKYFPMFTIV